MSASKYSIELWSPDGELLADFSGRADGRYFTQSRNEPETIQWSIDLNVFEEYARRSNVQPQALLIPGQTEVRVRRRGTYLVGGQITYVETFVTPNAQTLSVRATGFLNLFKDRYLTKIYTGEQATDIAWDAIDTTQTGANASFGVTRGSVATVGTHDRTYDRTSIKDLLQNLTRVQVAAFDFEFTYNKIFHTYTAMGSNRPDVIFSYPGNIKSLVVPLDATGLANRVTAYGAGFGEEASLQVTVNDAGSQAGYKIREKIITPNSVTELDTLTDHANAELSAWAFPVEVPNVEVDGNIFPFVTDYRVGDYIRVETYQYDFLAHVNAMYRIEKREVKIDDLDNETVTLHVSR